MKVTYNWLKDFVEIKLPARKLADMLTMAGLEVTSIDKREGDYVFEIEITSNRPDWLSVIGVAREVAALTGKGLSGYPVIRLSGLNPHTRTPAHPLTISIQDKKDCPLYTGKIICDVKVQPSPDWLRKRLELVGCRSVNNIVDITNYILLETGEPLHAFDLDKLVSRLSGYPVSQLEIIVRRAKEQEEIITIDGIKRMLGKEILIIASNTGTPANRHTGKPIAIAGVMGGKDTEVSENTKNILLEAAIFDPIIVRRGRQHLGVQSESSYRFERGIDLRIVEQASTQAAKLIEKIAKGKTVLAKAAGSAKVKTKIVKLDGARVNKILGLEIKPTRIKQILNGLGLKTSVKAKYNLSVLIPSYRADLNLGIDLIEEIARIYGYENIPKSLPEMKPQIGAFDTEDLVSLTKNILVSLGLNEVVTYSLIDKNLLANFGSGGEAIEILNPLSKEQEILRPQLIPSLCRCIAYNLNQKQDYINIFEIAHVYSGANAPKEELALAVAMCGVRPLFTEQGLINDEAGLLHLKGILEVLFERLGIENYDFNTKDDPKMITIYVNQQRIGLMMRMQRPILDALDIKNKSVFALQILLSQLFTFANLKKKFSSLAKYPSISRDISFILREEISFKDVKAQIQEKGRPLLRSIKIVDYYKGKQIPEGLKGLTISCEYRCDERTLADSEIAPVHELICNMLSEQFGATIR